MPSTSPETLFSSLRDVVLLERAERCIEGRDPDAQKRVRELYDAAGIRASIASELLQAYQHGAAFSLLREAVTLYRLALSTAQGAEGVGNLLDDSANVAEIDAWFDDPDPLLFDRLGHDEALAKRAEIDHLLDALRRRIEPRTLAEIKRARRFRLALLALPAAFALALALWFALSPTNLARGRAASASSHHPKSTAPPNGLTDGKTGGAYGVHTQEEESAWVMVDLGRLTAIGAIKVFNRNDGYFDEGLPFALELSDNGEDFAVVDERTTSFSRLRPWIFDARGQQARYVRVRKLGRGYVALSEIEVYGAR